MDARHEFAIEFFCPELQKRLWQFSVYECWYGYKTYPRDTIIGEYLHSYIDIVCSRIEPHLNLALDGPVLDQMYFIVVDDKYCRKSFMHRYYVLALAKLLFKRNRLYFSTADRKYTYMDKIGQITEEVTTVIKGKIAKNTIYNCLGILFTGFVMYKYW
jgi:hypothetical protein